MTTPRAIIGKTEIGPFDGLSYGASLHEWASDYFGREKWEQELGIDLQNSDDEVNEKIREYIQDHGQLIEFDGGIIVSSF
jgi:hypothetical protein